MRTTTKVAIQRRFGGLAALLALLLALAACAEKKTERLDPRDQPLLHIMVQLAEIRILAQEYPDSAQVQLDAFLAVVDTTGMAKNLAVLWEDPLRGRFFLQALNDSLKAPLQLQEEAPGGRARVEVDEDGI